MFLLHFLIPLSFCLAFAFLIFLALLHLVYCASRYENCTFILQQWILCTFTCIIRSPSLFITTSAHWMHSVHPERHTLLLLVLFTMWYRVHNRVSYTLCKRKHAQKSTVPVTQNWLPVLLKEEKNGTKYINVNIKWLLPDSTPSPMRI